MKKQHVFLTIHMYTTHMGGARFSEGRTKLLNNMLGFAYCLDFIKAMEKKQFLVDCDIILQV